MSEWQGKIAVITGAGSGIGAGLARHCMALGMAVVAADIDSQGLKQLQADAGNVALSSRVIDVSDAAAVENLAEEVFAEHGRVNLLFNNAGVLVGGKSWERSTEDWRWLLDVNVMGVVNGIRSFVPRMLAQSEVGRVINTSSIGGLLGGSAYMAPYQGSKHMITAITESLYQELKLESTQLSASVLCPAEVATGIFDSDRLRPEGQRVVLGSEGERQTHAAIAEGVADGMDCDTFARLVFEGIEAGRFWLLPQPEFKPLFAARSQSVLEESNPRSMMEMLDSQ